MNRCYKKDLENRFDDFDKVMAYLEYALGFYLIGDGEPYIEVPNDHAPFDIDLLKEEGYEYSYDCDYNFIVVNYSEEDDYLEPHRESVINSDIDNIPAYLAEYFDSERYAYDIYPDLYSIGSEINEYENYYFIKND